MPIKDLDTFLEKQVTTKEQISFVKISLDKSSEHEQVDSYYHNKETRLNTINEAGKESIRKNTEKSADEEMQRRLNSNNPMNHEERTE
jgi:hypothetical protein